MLLTYSFLLCRSSLDLSLASQLYRLRNDETQEFGGRHAGTFAGSTSEHLSQLQTNDELTTYTAQSSDHGFLLCSTMFMQVVKGLAGQGYQGESGIYAKRTRDDH